MTSMQTPKYFIGAVFAGIALTAGMAAMADAPIAASAVAPPRNPVAADAATPAAVAAPASSNQIWECTTNGLRTFSSNPCGTKSTVRQLNPINVMEPAPVYHVTHTYAPSTPPPAPVQYNYPAQDNADETYPDNANAGYPTYIVVPRARHQRPHNARSHPHPHHP
jgi:hypothetical protein